MKNLLLFLILVLVSGCADSVLSDNQSFTDNRWYKTQSPTFEFEIEQAGMYDVFIDFSHVYNGIPFAALPMQLSFSGAQSNQIDIDLPIIEDGEQAGDCAGDYCDLQAKAGSVQLQAGQYKVALSQDFDHEFLPNVIRAGVTIKKVQ